MKKIILTLSVFVSLLSCSNDEDNPNGGGVTGGKCYEIYYKDTTTYPYFKESARYETTKPSTNGKTKTSNGYYEVKCF